MNNNTDLTLLTPFIYTHQWTWEGGRKTHIGFLSKGDALCGFSHPNLGGTLANVSREWVEQGVISGELCLRCARVALKLYTAELTVSKND